MILLVILLEEPWLAGGEREYGDRPGEDGCGMLKKIDTVATCGVKLSLRHDHIKISEETISATSIRVE